MIKVLIVDDEPKVCRLIRHMLEEISLQVKVIGIAHDGISAIGMIDEQQPNIVITDIRMPGCDGLEIIRRTKEKYPNIEFIVISGHKQFEYAKEAIKYGVSDYLLKPIDQEELTYTLERAIKKYLQTTDQLSNSQRLEIVEQENRKRKRHDFSAFLLTKHQEISLAAVNEQYSYSFQPGIFQLALLKVDGIENVDLERMDYLYNRIEWALGRGLPLGFEHECIPYENMYILVLNYSADGDTILKCLNEVVSELVLQQELGKEVKITIGLGLPKENINHLGNTIKSAMWALDQRLVEGSDRVIQGEERNANALVDTEIFNDFNNRFQQSIEAQNLQQMFEEVDELQRKLSHRLETTGYEILQMCLEAMNIYIFKIKELGLFFDGLSDFFADYSREIRNKETTAKVFAFFKKALHHCHENVIAHKAQEDNLPIRIAKNYIQEHFTEPITLDAVSKAAGFTSAYFSQLFKKEIGITFSEYLLKKRMEYAKKLLRETNKSVIEVCEQVGYSDVKHFTKSFKLQTNLKPKEYRKMYS